MENDQTKESLLHENRRLLNNFNLLRQLLLVYRGKLEHSQIADNLKRLLEQCVVKYNETPLIIDDGSFRSQAELIEYLKSKNSGLHHLIHNLFEDLLEIERRLYDAHMQDFGDLQAEDEEMKEEILPVQDTRTEKENSAMISKIQDLQETLNKLQQGVEEEERLRSLNENIIKELGEEKDGLKEKVKQLEEKLEDKSTWSDKTVSYLEEKQKWDVEKTEFEAIMGVLTTHIREAKYSTADHKEELMRTVKLQGIYKNVIKAFLRDTEKLYEEILKNTDKIQKPPLCKRISGSFCLKWKRNEKKMRFLLKEKHRATNEVEELEAKVKRARHILNIFRAIVEDQQKELGIIYERTKSLDERLQENEPPLCKRLARLLCGRRTDNDDNILHRQKCHNRNIAETLERKMKDIQKLHYIYEILTEKIEDKIVRLHDKVKIIDDRLLSLNNHPLMAQELVKILSQR